MAIQRRNIIWQNGNEVEVNYERAFKWFLSSVQKENPDAQYGLAVCYMDGIEHKNI